MAKRWRLNEAAYKGGDEWKQAEAPAEPTYVKGRRVGWMARHMVCGAGMLTITEDAESVVLAAPCACGYAVLARGDFDAVDGEWATQEPTYSWSDQVMVPGSFPRPRVTETWHSVVATTFGGGVETCPHEHATRDEAEACARETERRSIVRLARHSGGVLSGEMYRAAWASEAIAAREAEEVRKREQAAAEAATREAARIAEERAQWTGWADGDLRAEYARRDAVAVAARLEADMAQTEANSLAMKADAARDHAEGVADEQARRDEERGK